MWEPTRRSFSTWAVPPVGPPAVADAAIAVVPGGIADNAHVVVLRESDSVLLHSIRFSDGSWQPFQIPSGPDGQDRMRARKVAVTNTPETSSIVVAVVDENGTVQAVGRKDKLWGPWLALQPPLSQLTARLVAVFGVPPSFNAKLEKARTLVVASFDDGNLYYCYVQDIDQPVSERWRLMPYPATSQFAATGIAVGSSAAVCDPPGSAAVWVTSQRKTATEPGREDRS